MLRGLNLSLTATWLRKRDFLVTLHPAPSPREHNKVPPAPELRGGDRVPTLPIHGRRRGAPLAAIGLLLSCTLVLAPAAVAVGPTLSTPYPSVVV